MITVDKLDVVYGAKEKRNHVVRGVSLTVNKGETLGIVGESGCGKSTLLRSLAGLEGGWTGSISFNGKPVGKTRSRDELKLAQMVFQDPYGSLHPRHRIGRALAEPIRAMGLGDGWSKVPAALQQVAIQAEILNLLADQREERDLTFVLVSHDLAVIAHMCDRVLVMQNGVFVDELTKADLEAGVTHAAYSGELFESSFL